MPIPTIRFADSEDAARHDDIATLQMQLNHLYAQIAQASTREKIVYQRQFDTLLARMDTLITALFDLGELDEKIPSIEALYKGL